MRGPGADSERAKCVQSPAEMLCSLRGWRTEPLKPPAQARRSRLLATIAKSDVCTAFGTREVGVPATQQDVHREISVLTKRRDDPEEFD